jgi:drug/metabolite transporter (DMT)-like permease
LSISTTKVLLVQGTPPLLLTIQQLLIGSTVLRALISWRQQTGGSSKNNKDEQKLMLDDLEQGASNRISNHTITTTVSQKKSPIALWQEAPYLVGAGVCFTLGFLATNFGFQASSASFVETIKAAEPLTSAGLAVGFGLEALNTKEWASLSTLIAGVLASTLGNSSAQSGHAIDHNNNNNNNNHDITLMESLISCAIVMVSNLCFSLRGLYQKWYLQEHEHTARKLEAEELQAEMQQLGVWVLIGPALVGYGKWGLGCLIREGVSIQYIGLALVNGLAFTSYK